MMIPFPVIMVPTYMLFQHLGWIGTFKPLWVPAWFGSAFNIFLLRQFFLGIPKELEESALLDGCSRWGCFYAFSCHCRSPHSRSSPSSIFSRYGMISSAR